jgi:hypothetical protein
VVVCWTGAGRTAVSLVVVVVLVTGLSEEQDIRNIVARMENSDVRMVRFFIVGW